VRTRRKQHARLEGNGPAKILCRQCAGLCCRYFALPIDTPKTRADFDDVRWYLAHEGISVFVEDGDWYLNIAARCRFLDPDNRCGIYPRRPRICRGYEHDACDFHSGDYGYELHFTCLEDLDDHLARRRRPKRPRGKPAPPRPQKKRTPTRT